MKELLFLVTMVCMSLFTGMLPAQTFPNAAKDSKESPHIERLKVSVDGKDLVLRFEGKLNIGRQNDVLKANSNDKFHHADNQLIITLNNEELTDYTVTVAPDTLGKVTMTPAKGTFVLEPTAAVVRIPLAEIKFSPVEIIAEVQTLFFGAAGGMVATQGRNLFASDNEQPARVDVAGLAAKPTPPTASGLQATDVGAGSVTLEWTTNNRTQAQVKLTAEGQELRTVEHAFYARQHKVTIMDLQPDTKYTATVSGRDFSLREVTPSTLQFQTPKYVAESGPASAWLRVKGKYIVNSVGQPFPLGGYSHAPLEYYWNEFPRYGTTAMTARYFRSLGLNCCRLGLFSYLPNHWAAGFSRDVDPFVHFGGIEGYVKKFVRPLADQIMNEGVYVIIDWHWTYGMTDPFIEQIGQFWEACAKEFKDEPRVAMYQLLNEPCFKEGQNRPDLAGKIRKITKDYIQRVRKHDRKHIILVSDWNCGWGWATESQWQPVNFDPGDPVRQIAFSKHISKEHTTDAFMIGGVDRIADQYDVPMFFDEVECSSLMPPKDTAWFYNFLFRNPRKYGYAIWVVGQQQPEYPSITAAFAQTYLPQAPFGSTKEKLIINWWRSVKPEVTERKEDTLSAFSMPKRLPAGDYGIVIEELPLDKSCALAVKPKKTAPRMIGAWLGHPGIARWCGCPHYAVHGESIVPRATYFEALEPFEQLVLKIPKKDGFKPEAIQIFRLNQKHQMPLPKVPNREVE